jgi:hypothetical protein
MKKLTTLTLTAALLVLTPAAAFADDSSSKSASTEQATPGVDAAINSADAQQEKKPQSAPDNLAALKAKAAEAIAKRQRDLATWSAKVSSQTTDCGQNAAVLSRIGATQAGLTLLGTSIAAAATTDVAKPLYQQIFTHQRVYLVVSPVVHTALACDAQFARASRQATNVTELNTKIAAAKAKGVNTAAAEALVAQVGPLTEAGKSASAAAAASLSGIAPDQGNEATKTANGTAVTNARNGIKTADASFDKAADLLKQAGKALGSTVKTEKAEEKADKKAEHEAEKAEKKAEQEAAKANRQKGKSGK